MENIDFIVKTFKRYDCLETLLKSIYQFYPEASIIVADDNDKTEFNAKFYKKWKDVKLIRLPFDSGLSMGRNEAVKASTKPFILLLDDDFIFTSQTVIENFYKIINSNNKIGVVGGLCLENNREVHYEHLFHFDEGVLRHLSDGDKYCRIEKIKAKPTECVLNFALFRREVFNDIQWDENLKLAEHLDFYLRFKETKWLVYYTPQVKVIHARIRTADYGIWRKRGKEFSYQMFKKNRIRKMITISGTVTEIRGREMLSYKIKL